MSAGNAVILFDASTHALRAEKVLQRAGIECKLIPVPRHLSSDCGVCLRVTRADAEAARQAIEQARVAVAAVHDA
jgi:hypothetical protein